MAHKIKAYVKRPDEEYGHSTWISNTLENLQKTVGGYIECITLVPELAEVPGVVVICDEEGLIKQKKYNCNYAGVDFVGDIVIVGCKGEEFCDVPIGWEMHKKMIGAY